MNKELINPPIEDRERELWMQHGAGYLIFENIRKYAISKIPSGVEESIRHAHLEAIDHTIYGLMMQMDGMFNGLENEEYSLELQTNIVLSQHNQVIQTLNTLDGDGMCMAFHDWKEGDFGDTPLIKHNK